MASERPVGIHIIIRPKKGKSICRTKYGMSVGQILEAVEKIKAVKK